MAHLSIRERTYGPYDLVELYKTGTCFTQRASAIELTTHHWHALPDLMGLYLIREDFESFAACQEIVLVYSPKPKKKHNSTIEESLQKIKEKFGGK